MEWEKASREELIAEGKRLERLLELFAQGRVATEQETENAVAAAVAAERLRVAKIRGEEFGRMYVDQVNALEAWNDLQPALMTAYQATRNLVESVRVSAQAFAAEHRDQATQPSGSSPETVDQKVGSDSQLKDALEAFANLDMSKLQ